MKKQIVKYLIAFSVLLTVSGCDRRPLEEELSPTASIPVKIYWDQAEIPPQNATIMFYDTSGNLYKEWRTASLPEYAEGSVNLPQGKYTAVAFNELRDQIDYVHMQGWNKFETFEALVTNNPQTIYTFSFRVEKETQVHQPGILATCVKTFSVTPEMITHTSSEATDSVYNVLNDLHPFRITSKANLLLHVKGLNNARMPAVAELRHMASGYFFATNKNTLDPVTTQFTINNRTYYPGSKTDGTLSTVITTFGVPGERHHTIDTPDIPTYLDIAFMLADKEQTIVEYSIDISNIIKIIINEKNAITIDIEAEIGSLPQIDPIGGNSGFSTDLVEWDKIIIPIKMGNKHQ